MTEQYKGDFVTEEELKQAFKENYVNRQFKAGTIKRYSFEAMRYGGADLVTVELYKEKYQIRAFEFKLTNWRKALLQANLNYEFANQSFIVIPERQVKNVYDKGETFKNENNIGIIAVDPTTKRWRMLNDSYPHSKKDSEIRLSQDIFKLLLGEI